MRFFVSYMAVFSNILFALALLIAPVEAEGKKEFYKIVGKQVSGKSITETKDGYIIAGGAYDKGRCCIGWVMKTDKRGDMLWEKRLGENYNDYNFMKVESAGGKVVAAGATDINYKPSWQGGVYASASGWIVKLDEDGSIEWNRKLTLTESLRFEDMDIVESPSVLATDVKGVNGDKAIIGGFRRYGVFDDPMFWMVDAKGEVEWKEVLGIDRGRSISPGAIYPLQGGDLASAGGFIDHNNNTRGTWLARIGPKGAVLWEKFMKSEEAGNEGLFQTFALAESGGGIILGEGREYLKIKTEKEGDFSNAAIISGRGSVRVSKFKADGGLEWEKRIEAPYACVIRGLWINKRGEITAAGETCPGEEKRIWTARISASGRVESRVHLTLKGANVNQIIPSGEGFIAVGLVHNDETGGPDTWVYKVPDIN